MADENKKEVIEEGYGMSRIARGRLPKMQALSGAFAIGIARKNKDPLFDRMIRFKKAYKVVKKQILAKYGIKGKMAARKAATLHKA
jgi:hypothetical protein